MSPEGIVTDLTTVVRDKVRLASRHLVPGQASTAESVMALSLPLLLSLFFVASPAFQRNILYATFLPAGLWVLTQTSGVWRRLAHSPLMLAIVLFVLWHPVTMLWSPAWTPGTSFDEAKAAVTLTIFAIGLFHLLVSGKLDLDGTLRVFVITAGMSGAAAIFWHYGVLDRGHVPLTGFGAADNQNIAATLYGAAALAALVYVVPRRGSSGGRALFLLAAAFCCAFVILSESRAGLLGLTLSLAASVLVTRQWRLAAGLLAVILLAAALALAGGIDVGRMLARGDSYRFDLWRDAIWLIVERPLLGHGVLAELRFSAEHMAFRSPHNFILSTYVFAGLPATILLFIILIMGSIKIFTIPRCEFSFAISLLIIGVVAGFFDFRTLVDGMDRAWLVIWLPLVLIAARAHSRAKPERIASQLIEE